MNNMRRGFTMIELIFVIVIIGILAAVAIPKLAATRDDAKVAQLVANLRTFTEDVKNYYQANGDDATANPSGAWGTAPWDVVSDVLDKATAATRTTGTANTAFNIGNIAGDRCFTVTEKSQNVTLNGNIVPQKYIEIKDGPDNTKSVCVLALQLADKKGLHKKGQIDKVVFAGQSVAF